MPRRRKMGAILAGYERVSTRKKPRRAARCEVAAGVRLRAGQRGRLRRLAGRRNAAGFTAASPGGAMPFDGAQWLTGADRGG